MRTHNIAWLLVALGLCACSVSNPASVEDDTLAFVGRAQLPIGEGESSKTTIEFAASWFGDDAKVRNPVGGAMEYEVREVSAAARYAMERGSLEFSVLAGLATEMLVLDTRVNSGAPLENDEELYLGPMLGVEAGWRPSQRVRIYTRLSASALIHSASVLSAEVGLGLRVVDEFEMLAGYRTWRFEGQSDAILGGFDDLELDVDGIFVGGELRF
jgi:hypothetical protein